MNRLTLALLLLALNPACTDAELARGTAKACDPCTWDGDCADGFFCDTDGTPPPMVCKTAKMAAESVACEEDCAEFCIELGRCGAKAVDGGYLCAPRNITDCQQSKLCVNSGAASAACQFCPQGIGTCGPCSP